MNPPAVLTPAARPRRPYPSRFGLALVIVSVLNRLPIELPEPLEVLSGFVGVISAIVLAIWAEERIYLLLSPRGAARQLLWTALLVPVSVSGGSLAAGLVGGILEAKLASAALFIAGLWMSSAATGTWIVLAIDALGRSAASRFATRIRWTVLGIVGVWSGLGTAIALVVPRLVKELLVLKPDSIHLEVGNSGSMTGDELQQFLATDPGVPEYLRHVAAADLLSFGLIATLFLLLMPAVFSAAAKLGELAVERIHPLDMAMERVGAGDLEVQVEEAGASELMRLAVRFNQMVRSLELAKRMELAFGAYVSRPVLERIRAQHGAHELPVIQRDASVFFADVRGFTSMSERLPPGQVLEVLRRYYAAVLEVVAAHEGYVDKFIGDAIYVVFNGPIEQPDHVERAARCALGLLGLVEEMNAAGAFPEIGRLEVGVGLATGPVIAGNLGTSRSTQFSVLGDTVNLAARLSGHAPAGEVWASPNTAASLPTGLLAEPLQPLQLKGKLQPVTPHRILVDKQDGLSLHRGDASHRH
ncbi:MAG: adenylate/guanylate cyclase domain-containing protein [Myxococcota bacterium]